MPRVWTARRIAASALLGTSLIGAGRATPAGDDPVVFRRDIRPILARNCFACHGPDEDERQAGVRLDTREGLLADPGDGPIVAPGSRQDSLLWYRITHRRERRRMPPPESGQSLSQEEVQRIGEWIDSGAPWEAHWSFTPPRRPALPEVSDPGWCRTAVDRFVLARLEAAGLRPSPEADRATRLRRARLDITGLPPRPEEARAFLSDERPDAWERLVDRLLASPAHGERMARKWLDLARYADSAGYGSDPLRSIWRYRDWVIDAYNRNLPYDRFTVEQLAGDLLPDPGLRQILATAFHRNTKTNTEGGTDDEEFRVEAVKDRTNTTLQVWMGLTAGCAQCHSHKFDPITHTEYYRLFAFFNQTADADRADEAPRAPTPTPAQRRRIARLESEVAELESEVAGLETDDGGGGGAGLASAREELARRREALDAVDVPTTPVLRELPPERRRTTHVLELGNFLQKGEEVEPGVPEAFHPFPGDAPRNRLGLARWIVSPENPLTARVAVNRLWARLFGRGIVATEEDFGSQGTPPTHPKLLDWLAVELVESGWNLRYVLRTILLSATYRQSSDLRPAARDRDPDNRLLWRMPRYRLDAETLRDQALALSGLLARELHGPSVHPPQPEGLWRAAFNGQRTWPTSEGADRYRRGIYTFLRRTVPYPSLAVFDMPSREICTLRRVRTSTPLQAFVTLNDPVWMEFAQALGRRIVREGGETDAARARWALRLVLVRAPRPAEVEEVLSLVRDERARYRERPEDASRTATGPLGPLPEGADPVEHAAWTVVAQVLLNLDAVLVKG